MNNGKTAGDVRKEMYAYLESQGLKITDEIHKEVRAKMVQHSQSDNEKAKRDVSNHLNALQNVKFTPKLQIMEDRLNDFKCPFCGLKMEKTADDQLVYVSKCGHFKNVAITYA